MRFTKKSCLILTLLFALSFGCAKKPADDAGGQDGGGGFVAYSKPEEVEAAINQALALARNPEFTQNIYYYFASHYYLTQVNVYPEHIRFPKDKTDFFNQKILKTLGSTADECLGPDAPLGKTPPMRRGNNIVNKIVNGTFCKGSDAFRTFLPSLMREDRLHIEIKKAGNCGRSGQNHADASVSKSGTELCFSIERLQRVPPTSLLREVLSLLYHEIFHIVGLGEDDARIAQVEFGRYFDSEFGTGMRDRIFRSTDQILDSLLIPRVHLNGSIGVRPKFGDSPANDPTVIMAAAEIYRGIMALPAWNNPLALQIAFDIPIGPAIAYTSAVSHALRIGKDPLTVTQTLLPEALNLPELTEKLTEFKSSIDSVYISWHIIELRLKHWSCTGFLKLQNLGDPTAFEQVSGLAPAGPFLFPIKAECQK